MSDRNSRVSRRNFLLTLGAGGAATAAAVIAKAAPERPVATADRAGRAARGYRESAHVTRYYRTTKV
ncbi:MAG TPA: twin-arginine translocation signal domain-containing protein [Burkholderiales bacterium]|nr:twin-arginine translocation signal domain-containing protein [Burkholderiales bacterium]